MCGHSRRFLSAHTEGKEGFTSLPGGLRLGPEAQPGSVESGHGGRSPGSFLDSPGLADLSSGFELPSQSPAKAKIGRLLACH